MNGLGDFIKNTLAEGQHAENKMNKQKIIDAISKECATEIMQHIYHYNQILRYMGSGELDRPDRLMLEQKIVELLYELQQKGKIKVVVRKDTPC